MGKKRRLIKAQSKFGSKHSSHPMFKKFNIEKKESTIQTAKEQIKIKAEDIEDTKVEIKKIEEKPTIIQPIAKTKPVLDRKNTKVKKDTPKSRRKKTAARKSKTTKPTND